LRSALKNSQHLHREPSNHNDNDDSKKVVQMGREIRKLSEENDRLRDENRQILNDLQGELDHRDSLIK
jgi:hypothetical protein